MSATTCAGCQAALAAGEGRYNDQGDMVCRACLAKAQIAHQAQVVEQAAAEGPAHGEIIYGSIGAFVLALISLVARHKAIFFLFPICALIGGVIALVMPLRYKEVRAALGWKLIPHCLLAIFAIVISTRGFLGSAKDFDDGQEEIRRDIRFDDNE